MGEVVVTREDVENAVGRIPQAMRSDEQLSIDADAVQSILGHPDYPGLVALRKEVYGETDVYDPRFAAGVDRIMRTETEILGDTGAQSHQEQIAYGAFRLAESRSGL
jgi:hypothetical protein